MEISDPDGASALCSGGGEAASQTYAGDKNLNDNYDDSNGDNNHHDVLSPFDISV